ncbi:MAG: hypothetical protein GY832_44735 [Chloroflexi bacterium]|nr:hypothetical protein [Chloroflexota bacterium]
MAALVGFCGSRSLSPQFAPLVRAVVAAVRAGGRGVAVGCSPGVRVPVVAAAPGALVFRAGSGQGAFPRRSAQFVQAVAASGPGCQVFAFVVGPCPARVSPSPSPARCFCGGGSGTWAELALAVGLGVPVSVFWCASGAPSLPSWWPGQWLPTWSPASHSVQAFSFMPAQAVLL